MLKRRGWRKQQKTCTTCSSHLGRYTPLTLLPQLGPQSHGLLSPRACNITATLYFPSLAERRRCAPGSDQPLLYYVQVAAVPSANYFFIVLDSSGFRFLPPRKFLTKVCPLQNDGLIHESCMFSFYYIPLKYISGNVYFNVYSDIFMSIFFHIILYLFLYIFLLKITLYESYIRKLYTASCWWKSFLILLLEFPSSILRCRYLVTRIN